MTATLTPRLRTRYKDEIRSALQEELGLTNIMLVPKIDKIVLNMGVGDAVELAQSPLDPGGTAGAMHAADRQLRALFRTRLHAISVDLPANWKVKGQASSRPAAIT